MDALSEAWLVWQEMNNVPPNTVAARRRVLRLVGNAGTQTREEFEAWWATRQSLSPSTRAADLSHLRSFYRWCQRWERRADDPTTRIDAPAVPKGLPRPVNRADLAKLLQVLPDDLRRATCLGAYAGLRVSEAAALDWKDVDVDTRRLAILDSKGGKSRFVKVSVVLLDHILPDTGGNVVAAGGRAPSAKQLQQNINRAIHDAGVNATFHQLRHRFGTLAYQATGDLLAVGSAMGHKSPVTTAIYAQASGEMADRIADAVVR